MNEKNLLYAVAGLVLGVVLMGIFANRAVVGQNYGMMRMMGMNQSGIRMNSENIDRHFIEQMIPHHEDAVAMADLAMTKAEHPEIKQLATNIKTDQSKEIEKMEEWYKDWFGADFSLVPVAFAHSQSMMQMGMMGDATDLETLENSKPFDKAFIEQMIPHHQMAVMMAEMLKRSADRDEMKILAHDIIDSQTAEIEQMRDWYKTWYK